MKKTLMDVTYTIHCLEEDIPVRGNVMASGDDALDKEAEDATIAALGHNPWAWCTVKVVATVTHRGAAFTGYDYLSCCSYENEAAFCSDSGYFPDMKKNALQDLQQNLRLSVGSGEAAADVLKQLMETL